MAPYPGKHPVDTTSTFCVLQQMVLLFAILVLFIACTGCFSTSPSTPASTDSGASGTGSSMYYLEQNVVTMSRVNPNGTSPEELKAVAIRDAMDYRNPVTRDFTVSLIRKEHGGTFRMSQASDLWEAVYSRWTYVEDPDGGDYFSPASRTIAVGLKGDCDDFAIVVAAMIESVGGDARIVYAQNETAGHAYPEVFVGTTQEEFDKAAAYIRDRYHVTDVGCHMTRDSDGTRYWLNLDWWSSHPGGMFYADDGVRTAYYPDGRWEQVAS